MVLPPKTTHPNGELSDFEKDPLSIKLEVDIFEGKVHVEWEPGASVTAMGQYDKHWEGKESVIKLTGWKKKLKNEKQHWL